MIASSLLTVSFFTVDKVVSDDTQTIIWLSADWHMDRNDPSSPVGTPWYDIGWAGYYLFGNAHDAVNDTNDIGVDYAWLVGDCISWYDTAAGYPGVPEAWRRFGTAWSNLTVTYDKNFTIGNHDGRFFDAEDTDTGYDLGLPRSQGEGGEWYYYDAGNTSGGGIRFICMADENTADGSQDGNGVVSTTQRTFVNNSIADAYDNDMSVFIFMHQKHSGWFSGSESSSTVTGATLFDVMDYWNGQGKPISLYACGHSHDDALSSNDWIEEHYGTTCMLIGSIAIYNGGATDHYPTSRYLYLTEGDKNVTIRAYNHYTDSFYAANDYTFELLYDWIPDDNGGSNPEEPEDDISIQSINGLSNNSITSNVNRSFNWTKINNTSCYNLQISNSSDFSTVFLNLSDINELNYAAYYTEKGSYVEFYLPYAYNISFYGDHYYRVRAYSYS